MAIIQDAFNPVNYQAGVSAANPADEPQSSEIVRGLRGGANSFMSGMNNAMGGVAQPMGFEDFAQGRFKAGREYEEQAQREGPSVASLRDVHGVGDAARFVMGQTGQMAIPMAIGVGSGLLTKSPGKGLAAATAAMTPETFGHAVGEYRHTNNDAPVDQNTALRLGGTAVASSAIQNIVPAGVGSMLRGGGAAANAARGFMPTMGRAVATDIGGNAVASGAADMLTQKGVNPDRQIDVARSLDAAATGGVMGVPFVGAHAVGYGIHSAPRAGVDAAVTGTKSIKDRLKEKLGAVVGADPAPEKAKPVDHVDALNEITSRAEDPMTETMAAGGRPDPTLEATAEGQAKNDATAFEWAKTKGEELMKSTGLTKANYDSLAQAMQDPANPAAQKTIALITQGVEKAKGFGKTVADMARALDTHMVKSADEAKKSEDYSGTRAAISEHVVPWLEANKPEVLGDPVQINAVADGVRRFMDFATKNRDAPIPTEISSAMNRLFDGDVGLLSKLHEAVIGDADAAKSANYVNTVKELARDQARSKTFEEFIGHSMTDGAFSARQVPLVADRLIAWANEKHPAGKSDGEKAALSAQAELKNLEMEQYMRLKFGDKADAVEQALKAHVTKSRDEYAQQAVKKAPLESDGEYSGPPAEEALDRIIHKKDAKSKAPDAVMDPALFDSSKQAGLNYGKQQLADAKAKYPDHDVRWVSGDDLTKMTGQTHEGGKDHGHIVAEKAADPERITPAELKTMQLDAKRHNTSKSRIDAKTSDGKPLILDAVGITQAMLAKLPKVEGETYADREKRAFLSGVAELMREHGKFEIKPETVISYSGGGATKFGEINKLGKSGTEDRMSKSGQEKLAALRENYKEATSVEKKDILKEVQKLHEFEKDRELSNDPNDARPSTNFDDKGNLSSEGARALLESAGRMEVGADDHLRVSSAALGDKGVEVRSNMDGTPRSTATRSKNDHVAAVADMAHELKAKTNPGAQALGAKLEALSKIMKHLPDAAQEDLMIASGRKMPMSERMALVNPLAEKYKDKTEADFTKTDAPKTIATKPLNTLAAPESILAKQIDKRQEYLNNPPENYSAEVAKGHIDWAARQLERVDAEYEKAKGNQDRQDQLSDYRGALKRLMTKAKSVLEGDASLAEKEGTPDPKLVAAKKAALVERAASGDKDLLKELSTSDDAKGLQRAVEVLAESAPESKALAAANERLAALVQDPATAYGMQRVAYSHEATGPTAKTSTDFQPAKDYLTKVAPWVKTMLANLSHAGEFTRLDAHDIIRLSTHALNPLSTAYHESLHAFFAKLSDAGAHDVMDVLNKAAASPHVMKQMREFLENEPDALKQLSDPEERAAYMYQMHALGELKLPPAATTIMGKVKAMLMKALGMWTNDARALHIMDYFQTGEYAQSMGNPSAVHRAMMDKGRNKAVEKLTEMAKPLSDLGMAVVGIGSQRLRDTGIPALREVADLVKATGREDHNDKGYLPTARDERATRMNDISSKLEGYTPEQLGDALGSMQRGVEAKTAEGRTVQTAVQKSLADTLKYMRSAGVNIEHIGAKDGVPYFPRVWDTDYISKNKADFLNMLSKYERRGLISDSQSILSKMIARDGNEFGVESREPGMQFKKQRVLSMIDHVDAAEFMSKDLFQTLNSYITQATRRAEWSRRFADDGSTLDGLLAKAREQGAEDKHIDMTEQYLKGVDGTLGDSLDPTYRRLMGDVIVYQNIRLLPLAIFSSVVDPIGLMINGASAKDAWSTFKRGIREVPLGFKDQSKHAKDHWTEMAETLGVIDNATLHQSIGALYNQGMVGGTAQKINDTFFKLNLMEQYNRSMRIGATEAATRFIAKHAVEGESVHSTRWLAELGLKASDVKMHEGALALTEAHGLSKAEADKMRSAVNQWVDGAILRPDAADKPIWMNDPRWMLISHLKQFVYSFHQTILKKVGHEFTHGNHAPIMAMASYVPIMIAADMMKGMIQGAGSQPDFKEGWGFGDYIWSGLQRAGLFGVGQFGLDVATDVQRGGVGIGALAGPTLGQMGDALELMGGHKQFAPFTLHAMPANALYSGIVKGGAQADPMFAD